jgi:hypothetical protein
LVEVGRGIVTSLNKYVNAVHGLSIKTPFNKLAAAGLMPAHSQPRTRVLQESDLSAWMEAVDKLGKRQRDFLLLTRYTGLRRNDCRWLPRQQIDLDTDLLVVPMTKNGKPPLIAHHADSARDLRICGKAPFSGLANRPLAPTDINSSLQLLERNP